MNSREEEKNELRQYGFPEEVLQQLYELTDVDDYDLHLKARRRFADGGEAVLPVMHKLLHSKQRVIRKQAAKVLELIAHPSSIDELLAMLEDDVSGIRWIAAEALIKIGRASLRPLLKTLARRADSYNFRLGAHHVLAKLVYEDDPEELKHVKHLTRSGGDTPEIIPVHAARALKLTGF
ncbi:MAG: HEAT repeat domain-containing protein [Bacteroidales bacterium]|nr:HEAT repeat domain-containing protein [Bacteroidales bacterium]